MGVKKINIYPPIVDEWLNAHILGENIKIYITISSYMSIADIRKDLVLVTVKNQSTNRSVIKKENNYNSDLYITSLKMDEDGRYYIELRHSMLNITNNQYYKVQFRFVSAEYTDSKINFRTKYASNTLQDYISDYSKVVLIKPISPCFLDLIGFQNNIGNNLFIFSTSAIAVVGKLVFFDDTEEETLSSYKVQIFNGGKYELREPNDNITLDSENIITESGSPNSILYNLKIDFQNENYYFMRIYYTTVSNYTGYEDFAFKIQYLNEIILDNIQSDIQNNEEEACIELSFSGVVRYLQEENDDNEEENNVVSKGCCLLRRSSSEDNFLTWENLQYFLLQENGEVTFKYSDYLVKYGVFYSYQLVPQSSAYTRGEPYYFTGNPLENGTNGEIQCLFDSIKLLGSDAEDAFIKQIDVKFDGKIDNFQYTVVESKTDTLGGKYPFIRRNGDTYYRQFNISGLISHYWENDNKQEFESAYISKTDSTPYSVDDDNIDNYLSSSYITTLERKRKKYIANNNDNINRRFQTNFYNSSINGYNDYILEREYREKIMEFLYDNCIRLFKTPTEGNILIKLMNISLSPNETLGRMIYSFSATAYEIDEVTVENCVKYDIHYINDDIADDISKPQVYTTHKLGQLNMSDITEYEQGRTSIFKNTDLFIAIEEKIKELEKHYSIILERINWIRFNFTSAPNFINLNNLYTENKLVPGANTEKPQISRGYLIDINGNEIIVPPNGFYELNDKDTDIQEALLYYLSNEKVEGTIDYIATYQIQDYNSMRIRKTLQRYYILGQLHQPIDDNINIIDLIKEKHNITSESKDIQSDYILTKVLAVPYVSIEAEPGQVVQIQDASDIDVEQNIQSYENIIINDTGILTLYDKDTYITGIKFIIPNAVEKAWQKDEIMLSPTHALHDILIDYICYVEEARY